MKKLFLALCIGLYSLSGYAMPYVNLDGLVTKNLSAVTDPELQLFASNGTGTYSTGICRIAIRSNIGYSVDKFNELAAKFTFIYHNFKGESEVLPIVNFYSLMFKLEDHTDFGYEYLIIKSKNGKNIGDNVKDVFGTAPVKALAVTCY